MVAVKLCSFFFFFTQKTAYEMRISDWSSDVCSSDLRARAADIMFEQIVKLGLEGGVPLCGSIFALQIEDERHERFGDEAATEFQIGRAACRERGCQYV